MTAPTPLESGFASVNGARHYYEALGSGHPLVLLHAGIADSRMWDDQIHSFAERYRVIRYDARGFGRSDMPAAPYSRYDDLAALLDHLQVDKACILGSSMGGGTALDFTLAYPDRADALVLMGSAVGGGTPSESTIEQWNRIDELAQSGDLAGAVELELQMWVDGPRRTPQRVDASVRERVREMDATQ